MPNPDPQQERRALKIRRVRCTICHRFAWHENHDPVDLGAQGVHHPGCPTAARAAVPNTAKGLPAALRVHCARTAPAAETSRGAPK